MNIFQGWTFLSGEYFEMVDINLVNTDVRHGGYRGEPWRVTIFQKFMFIAQTFSIWVSHSGTLSSLMWPFQNNMPSLWRTWDGGAELDSSDLENCGYDHMTGWGQELVWHFRGSWEEARSSKERLSHFWGGPVWILLIFFWTFHFRGGAVKWNTLYVNSP